jgi:hypothetical protein
VLETPYRGFRRELGGNRPLASLAHTAPETTPGSLGLLSVKPERCREPGPIRFDLRGTAASGAKWSGVEWSELGVGFKLSRPMQLIQMVPVGVGNLELATCSLDFWSIDDSPSQRAGVYWAGRGPRPAYGGAYRFTLKKRHHDWCSGGNDARPTVGGETVALSHCGVGWNPARARFRGCGPYPIYHTNDHGDVAVGASSERHRTPIMNHDGLIT